MCFDLGIWFLRDFRLGSMFFVLEFFEPFFPSFDFLFFSGGFLSLGDAGLFWLDDLVEYCGVTFCWMSSVFLKISYTSWRSTGLVSLVSFRSFFSASLSALVLLSLFSRLVERGRLWRWPLPLESLCEAWPCPQMLRCSSRAKPQVQGSQCRLWMVYHWCITFVLQLKRSSSCWGFLLSVPV